MMRILFFLSLLLSAADAENYAVIVAGSTGYFNYRHQADACHAYHVVRRHGIPAENTILMMYDDVANSPRNPFPGKLYNKPGNETSAVDVYAGCNIDYSGEDVTPDMFQHVLLGDSEYTQGRKVLTSTKEDRVFINFVDHGAPGFVVFPHDKKLTSKMLTKTLKEMHTQGKYKELMFYMEACESGSMFADEWLRKINAFATTAANAHESSWGTYCPPYAMVNGKPIYTCLGDLYSVNWMEDSDLTDLSSEKVEQQYTRVRTQTSKSHVLRFGDPKIEREILGNFESTLDMSGADSGEEDTTAGQFVENAELKMKEASAVSARDVELVSKFYEYLDAPAGSDRRSLAKELVKEIYEREQADAMFDGIRREYEVQAKKQLLTANIADIDSDCQEDVLTLFEEKCGLKDTGVAHGFTSYSLQYVRTLNDLCSTGMDVRSIADVLAKACGAWKSRANPRMDVIG